MLVILGAKGGLGGGLYQYLQENPEAARAYGKIIATTRADIDVTQESSVASFFERLRSEAPAGSPLYIVNATGVSINGMCHKMGADDFQKTVSVNLGGAFLVLKYLQPLLKDRPGSAAVFFSSVVADLGVPGTVAYAATKSGLRGLVRTASKEFARFQGRVSAIELGYFDRGMINQVPAEVQDGLRQQIPLARFGSVRELFEACDFALRCGYFTGTTLKLNGGLQA